MILQTIYCSVDGCKKSHKEEKPNAGFPNWGHVVGVQNAETGETIAHLCPSHLGMASTMLSGGLIPKQSNDMVKGG